MCLTGVVAQAAVKHAAVAARCRRRDMVLKTNVCRVVHVCSAQVLPLGSLVYSCTCDNSN